MFKALTPLIGIIIAIGLFVTYVRPTFADIRGVQDETAQYEQAIEKASELQSRINELKQKQSSISLAHLERLEALLPNRIDEVSVLIDLDMLARNHGLVFGDIAVGDQLKNEGTSSKTPDPTDPSSSVAVPGTPTAPGDSTVMPGIAPESSLSSQYTTLEVTFSVTGSYDDFRAFLKDIEYSLVLMEVVEIKFAESEGDAVPFSMTVRLYSLNAPSS